MYVCMLYVLYIYMYIYIYIYIYRYIYIYKYIYIYILIVCWRPKNSPAEHGHRWPTVPLDESPPESNGKPNATGTTTQKRCHHQTKKRTTRTQSQACAHVVCRRRSVGRGVALRLQPKVLQSSSREVRATATRRSTARREHSHRLAPCGVLPVDGTGGLKFTPWPHERPNS